MYNAFQAEDHILHFYFLGGPDFVVGPDAPKAERNILGVINKVGLEAGKKVIKLRALAQEMIQTLGGKKIHQVTSIPGGVSVGLSEENRDKFQAYAEYFISSENSLFRCLKILC